MIELARAPRPTVIRLRPGQLVELGRSPRDRSISSSTRQRSRAGWSRSRALGARIVSLAKEGPNDRGSLSLAFDRVRRDRRDRRFASGHAFAEEPEDPPGVAASDRASAQPADDASRLDALARRYEQAYPDTTKDAALPSGDVERASLVAQLVQMFVVLGGVCLLAYVVLGKLLPRIVRGTTPLAKRRILEVVDRLPIDPRRSILVVEMASRYFLVGITEQGITLLSRLDEDDVKAALAATRDRRRRRPRRHRDVRSEGL